MFDKIGADTGHDSISDENSIKTMSRLFDRLNSENALPKTIVFNLNPKNERGNYGAYRLFPNERGER